MVWIKPTFSFTSSKRDNPTPGSPWIAVHGVGAVFTKATSIATQLGGVLGFEFALYDEFPAWYVEDETSLTMNETAGLNIPNAS